MSINKTAHKGGGGTFGWALAGYRCDFEQGQRGQTVTKKVGYNDLDLRSSLVSYYIKYISIIYYKSKTISHAINH